MGNLSGNISRKDIGEEIKKARKAKKLSQFELAELTGIDEKQIYRIESGLSSPKLENFLKISDILELKIDCFNFIDLDKIHYAKEILEIINKSSEQNNKIYYNVIKTLSKNI